jgi:multicomponent Na+:H+ antiporter subunit E
VIFANLLLALTWVALNGAFTLENLVVGGLLGRVVLLVLTKGGVLPAGELGRLERGAGLLGYLLWQIVLANFKIAKDVVSVEYRMKPGVIQLPLNVTTDQEILLLAAMINITPGSVALDVSKDRRVMYVHVMHIASPEEAKREIKEGFERRVLELRGESGNISHAA